MAHDKSTTESNNEAHGRGRFRLPKLFADSDATRDDSVDSTERIAQRAEELGVTLPPPITDEETIAATNQTYEGPPRASVLRVRPDQPPAGPSTPAGPFTGAPSNRRNLGANATDEVLLDEEARMLASVDPRDVVGLGISSPGIGSDEDYEAPVRAGAAPGTAVPAAEEGVVVERLDTLQDGLEEMSRLLQEICDRGTAQDKVFDTLHSELQDYKNDFIYEHLKPVVRPLLFLYDSMEQFDGEMAAHQRPDRDERRGVSPGVVRQNVAFFREQLTEALRICEVTPMQTPEGTFDPKCHKAVGVALVEADQENMIQRVVRSGWYLNGHVFRPAEVIVGRTTDDYNAQVWNYGQGKGDSGAPAA